LYLEIQEKALAIAKDSATTIAPEIDKRLYTTIKASIVKQSTTKSSEINKELISTKGPTINKASSSNKDLDTNKEAAAIAFESKEYVQELGINKDTKSKEGFETVKGYNAKKAP
jgi:arsenate reductase-like glutaredoxin family protein